MESITKAMGAALIPVVANIGGHTDFVLKKYRFNSPEDAAARFA